MYIQVFYDKIEETLKKLRGTQYVVHKRQVQRTYGEKSSVVTMLEVLPPINDTSVVSLMNKLVSLKLSYVPVVIYGQSIENNPELEKYDEPEIILKNVTLYLNNNPIDHIFIPDLTIKDITDTVDKEQQCIAYSLSCNLHDDILRMLFYHNLNYKVAAVSAKDVISILEL